MRERKARVRGTVESELLKLKELQNTYEALSGLASENARKLSFVGVAVIWIYRIGDQGEYGIPDELVAPLLMLVAALAADLLQYVVSSLVYMGLFKRRERLEAADESLAGKDFKLSKVYDATGWVFWIIKIVLTIVAYVILLRFLFIELIS